MGRNSRVDDSNTNASNYQGGIQNPAENLYQYGGEAQTASQRVVTDSENMARDIKDGRLSGFVGHGTSLTGDTNFQMMLRVDGHLQGTITSDSGTLLVGTTGQVDANVAVASATINGTVNGDILATEKIHLGRTAKVVGNIQTPKIVIEEGAVIEGGISMLKAREAQEKQAAEAKSQSQYPTSSSSYSSYSSSSTASAASDEDDDETEAATEEEEEEAAEAVSL
ncbi:MAG TPA: polymer-forming cytoskeletal protein [Pyrinomonadaceae bacterium]|nr:polymer-forming cytoskeletal protein [Pyrinomonadaceae bacterium]